MKTLGREISGTHMLNVMCKNSISFQFLSFNIRLEQSMNKK